MQYNITHSETIINYIIQHTTRQQITTYNILVLALPL